MCFFRLAAVATFVLLRFNTTTAQTALPTIKSLFAEKNFTKIVAVTTENKSNGFLNDTLLYYRAFALCELGETKRALKLVQRLLKTSPRFAEVYFLKGIISSTQENFAEAVASFQKSFKLDSTHLKSLYNLATAKGMLGDYKGAIKDLTDYLKCDSLNPDAFYSRGYWFEMQEDFEVALGDYNKTLTLKPEMVEAYFSKAYVYYKMNKKELACQALNDAEKTGSQAVDEAKAMFCK